jgi:hypothetical protein
MLRTLRAEAAEQGVVRRRVRFVMVYVAGLFSS